MHPRPPAAFLVSALIALCAALPQRSAASPAPDDRASVLRQHREYTPAFFAEDGTMSAPDLDAVVRGLRAAKVDRETQVVVVLHGFNADWGVVARDYDRIARLLARRDASRPGHFVMIGAHWPSDPGPMQDWLPKMAAYRFTTGLGFPSPVPNPYMQKTRVAGAVGRRGLRSLLFRIQDEFPGAPVSLWGHSMGSEGVVRALAPRTRFRREAPGTIDAPDRELHVSSVVLAGADLDQDIFTRRSRSSAREALPRADLWWFTVAKANTADAALEIRRGAGRSDAIGNRGLTLDRETLDQLISRHALLMDDEEIPIFHEMKRYYDEERLMRLRPSLEYLRGARDDASMHSQLADLIQLDTLSRDDLVPQERSPQLAVRLVARWKLGHNLSRFGAVRVLREERHPASDASFNKAATAAGSPA